MEILKITNGRMKITLSKEDLSEYALDAEELDYTRPETKKALDALLTVARIKAGMPLGSGRTYVQLYPSKDGGCEIFVFLKEKPGQIRALPSPAERGGYICFPENGKEERICAVFKKAGVRGDLYLDGEGDLCIFCRADAVTSPLLEEYGIKTGDAPEIYLREHYTHLGRIADLHI